METITSQDQHYRMKVFRDDNPENPCLDFCLAGRYFFEYTDISSLHDGCNWQDLFYDNNHNLNDVLQKLAEQYCDQDAVIKYLKNGNGFGTKAYYDCHDKKWHIFELYRGEEWEILAVSRKELKEYDYMAEIIEDMDNDELLDLIQHCGKDIYIDEYGLYGCCQGDYMKVIAYCSKDMYVKNCSHDVTDWKEKVTSIIHGEIDMIERYAFGNVYGFIFEEDINFYNDNMEPEWEELENVCGLFQDPDDIIRENFVYPEDE